MIPHILCSIGTVGTCVCPRALFYPDLLALLAHLLICTVVQIEFSDDLVDPRCPLPPGGAGGQSQCSGEMEVLPDSQGSCNDVFLGEEIEASSIIAYVKYCTWHALYYTQGTGALGGGGGGPWGGWIIIAHQKLMLILGSCWFWVRLGVLMSV